MAFPRNLLNDGEELVLDLKPHWWYFAGPAVMLAVTVVLLVLAQGADLHDYLLLAAAGVTVGALGWFVKRYLQWSTTSFVVTSDRLIYRHGVLAKRGIEIPLERVNTVFFNQTIWERLIGAGDLVIESGGTTGQQQFSDIRKPDRVQKEIHVQMEGNNERMYHGRGQRELSIPEQIDRLDDLRRRGVLTEEEFAAQKTKLLERM
ncbi:MAG TPA: PH domain-containing protein [Acidimicrobiales bacterium]|nr:PH domain-containing protein [Acidimicrobiales bacterium]